MAVGGAGQAPIARYVASSGFLCDGAIDARKCDIDVHPAYATQILGDRKHSGTDLRVRLAFCYADEQGDDEPTSPVHFFALPRRAEAAVDRGLALLAAWHCIQPDTDMTSSLAATACFLTQWMILKKPFPASAGFTALTLFQILSTSLAFWPSCFLGWMFRRDGLRVFEKCAVNCISKCLKNKLDSHYVW